MLWNWFVTGTGRPGGNSPAEARRKSSIMTGIFMVEAA